MPEKKYSPMKVFNEVVREGKKWCAPEASLVESIFKEKAISVCDIKDEKYLKFVKGMAAENESQPLHETEAEVLCLAKELNGIAVADDKVVRSVARLLGIEVHGTVYILGKLYSRRKIKKETLLSKVHEMRSAGWYISSEDYYRIIDYLKSL
jgi:predicted nucleic acid-binding protein